MTLWKRPLFARSGLVALGLLACLGVSLAADQRTWSDRSGKYKIQGKMVGYLNGVVTLERQDGSRMQIALAKLSTPDRVYVEKEIAAANKAKSKDDKAGENPFLPSGSPTPPGLPAAGAPGRGAGQPGRAGPGEIPGMEQGRLRPGRPGVEGLGELPGRSNAGQPGVEGLGELPGSSGAAPAGAPGLGAPPESGGSAPAVPAGQPAPAESASNMIVAKDWSGDLAQAKTLNLGNVRDSFPLAIGTGKRPAATPSPDPITLPAAVDFFDKINGLALSVPAGKAIVGRVSERPGSPDVFTRLYSCDLTGSARAVETKVGGNYAPLALSDDGTTLVVRVQSGPFGRGEKLELWSVAGRFSRLAAFTPYAGSSDFYRNVKHALFAGTNRLITTNTAGELAVWDVATGAPLYRLPAQRDALPAVSLDGKYLAVPSDNDVAIVDLTAGKAVARLDVKGVGGFPAVAFSPDGKRLAHVAVGVLSIFDLTTGQLEKSISGLFPMVDESRFFWPDADHVFVADTVYSVKFGLPLWNYTGGESARAGGEYTYYVASEGSRGPGALVPVLMPPPRAVKQLETASQDADFVILKPGSAIQVDATGVADPLKQAQVRIALLKRVEAAGYQVADDAKVVLKATTGFGKEQEMSYVPFGSPMFGSPFRPRGEEPKKHKVKPFFASLVLEYEGKNAWRLGGGGFAPPILHMEKGETIESALRKLEEPKYTLFDSVTLPKTLTKPLGNGASTGLGTSRVTTAGAR